MSRQLRRKRSVKENQNDEETSTINDQDDINEQIEEKPIILPVKATRSSQRNTTNQTISSNNNSNSKSGQPERVWVQCNTCDKWRSLPHDVDANKLPDIWVCQLNVYDLTKNNCEAEEESYKLPEEEEHVELKSFLKLWTKKLKNADRAENCLSSSAVTRGRKRKLDTEWLQCSSPSCGKWRAVSRGIETTALLRRLNKGKHHGSEQGLWFCSMNSWDDTTASCAAPQEPLWNCRWNLSNSGTGNNSD